MNDEACPRTVALSALADGMLAPDERAGTESHVAACAACAAALEDLRALQAGFAGLPAERLGFDLGAVVEARIARDGRPVRGAAPRRTRAASAARWLAGFALPLAGGAAALALGVQLGALLMSAVGPAAVPLAPVAVFDALPPGSLCAGSETCFADLSIR